MAKATIAPPDGLELLRTGCGLVEREVDGKLALRGPDAATFLDGQLSNAIGALDGGSGCYATLLTPKGRILADLRVLNTGAELLLLCERTGLQPLFDRLRTGLIGWDAELEKATLERTLFSLIGPRATEIVAAAGAALPERVEHANVAATISGARALVVTTDCGLDVVVATGAAADVREALLGAGARAVDEDAAEVLRVERGRPRHGHELDDSVIPQEAGLNDRAVSFTKGCYVGQETVARLHWRGNPHRRLAGLRLDGPVAEGDELHATDDGDRVLGRVGTVVTSDRLGTIALALVRDEAPDGARLAAGGAGGSAEVVGLPFAP